MDEFRQWADALDKLGLTGALLFVLWAIITGKLFTPRYVARLEADLKEAKEELAEERKAGKERGDEWRRIAEGALTGLERGSELLKKAHER